MADVGKLVKSLAKVDKSQNNANIFQQRDREHNFSPSLSLSLPPYLSLVCVCVMLAIYVKLIKKMCRQQEQNGRDGVREGEYKTQKQSETNKTKPSTTFYCQ